MKVLIVVFALCLLAAAQQAPQEMFGVVASVAPDGSSVTLTNLQGITEAALVLTINTAPPAALQPPAPTPPEQVPFVPWPWLLNLP